MKILLIAHLAAFSLVGALPAQDRQPFSISDDPETKPEDDVPSQTDQRQHDDAKLDDSKEEVTVPLNTQWLMFTAPWCAPCRAARADFEAWMRRSGWVIDDSPSAHVRLIDGDRRPDLVKQMRVAAYPTFILIRDNREMCRFEGYPGRQELVRRFRQAVETAPPFVRTVTAGTLKGQRENILRLIAAVRPLLGTDGSVNITLDRPGTASLELPLGRRLSIVSNNPLTMHCTLRNDVLLCRFAKPYPRGRFTFGLAAEQTISAVTISASEVVMEFPLAPDVRFLVEP